MSEIYKFVSFSSCENLEELVKGTLEKPTIKFATLDNLNDRMNEAKVLFTFDEKDPDGFRHSWFVQNDMHMTDLKPGQAWQNSFEICCNIKKNGGYELISKKALKKVKEEFDVGVCSLTSSWREPALWGMYADAGRNGYCIVYNEEKLKKAFSDRETYLYENVEYEDECKLSLNNLKEKNSMFKFLFTKYTHWQWEQEKRIIQIAKKGSLKRLPTISKNCIEAVILGDKIKECQKSKILEACRKNNYKIFEIDFGSISDYLPTKKKVE